MRTLAHCSDLHFGRHDPAIASALLESLNVSRPHLVIISGDLTQRARGSQFLSARRFLDQIQAPKLVVPGNHDIPLFNIVGRLLAPFSNFKRYISQSVEHQQFFSDDEIAVLGLNTVRRLNWKNGRVSERQLAEMEARFRALPEHVRKVLVTHHPIALVEGARRLSIAQRATAAVIAASKSGVHLVLSGHSHHAVSGTIDDELAAEGSLLVVHAGTAISTRTRAGGLNSYNLIAIDPPYLSVTIMEWSAIAGFREGPRKRYVFDAAEWQLAS